MHSPLSVVIATHDGSQIHDILRAIQQAGFTPEPEITPDGIALEAALARRNWDVLVAPTGPYGPDLDLALGLKRRLASRMPLVLILSEGEEWTEERKAALKQEGADGIVAASSISHLGIEIARLIQQRQPAPVSDTAVLPGADIKALADHLPLGVYRSAPDGRVLYANPALPHILGCSTMEELFTLDVRSDLGYPREHFATVMKERGEVRNLEYEWRLRDGRTIYTRENARAVFDDDGRMLYYEGTIEDITEERQAQTRERRLARHHAAIARFVAAADSAQRDDVLHAAAIEAVSAAMSSEHVALLMRSGRPDVPEADAVALVRPEFEFVAWMPAVMEAALRACEEAQVWNAFPAFEQPLLLGDVDDADADAIPLVLRAAMKAHGQRALVSLPLRHRNEIVGLVVALFPDPIRFETEDLASAESLAWHLANALSRFRAEHNLHKSEAVLEFIAQNTGQVLYRLSYETGSFDYLSPAVTTLTGYTLNELEAAGGLDALIEERTVLRGEGLTLGEGIEADGEAMSQYVAVYRLRCKDGATRWVENNAYLWYNETGAAVGLVGVLLDITERRDEDAAERARAEASAEFRRALTRLLGLAADPEELLDQIVATTAETVGVPEASLWEVGPEGRSLVRSYVHGFRDPGAAAPFALSLAHRAEFEALRVCAIDDLAEESPAVLDLFGGADPFLARGVRALIAAPVRREGRLAGVLTVEHGAEPRSWTEDEAEFVASAADLVMAALERAERSRAERALKGSEARYRAISELSSDYAFAITYGPEGTRELAWATEAVERVTGFTRAHLEQKASFLALVHPDDRGRVQAVMGPLGEDEQEVQFEARIVRADGGVRWIRHRARSERGAEGGFTLINTGQDISEQKRYEKILESARQDAEAAQARAEEAARMKSAFLANMSHEIRTPLTGILGFADLLAESVTGEQQEFVGFIEQSGRRLMETLNSVLDLARLEADGLEARPVDFDLADEVRTAVNLMIPLAVTKGLSLAVDAPRPVPVTLDRSCVTRILHNLVGNAIKFTEEGQVSVTVEVEGDRAEVTVRDTGVGIDEAFLPHLFDEFKQESSGESRTHEGSGLGLAITRRLVELLSGTISVESEKGAGATFRVSLPLSLKAKTHSPQQPPAPVFEPVFEEEPPDTESGPLRAMIEEAEEGDPDRPRVLVVEDNPDTRTLLARVLAPQFRVDTAADARSALGLLASESYQALLLDVHLGGKTTGIDVLRIARTLPGASEARAIAVTAYALPGDSQRLIEAGFDDYVPKPFTRGSVLRALEGSSEPARAEAG